MSKISEALYHLQLAIECLKEAEVSNVVSTTGLQKPDDFYDYIRGDTGELFPSFSQDQYDGVQIDLDKGAGVLPIGWMAYCLATDYHETNRTMQGVREAYWLSEDWRKTHLSYYPWYGRGKVQLTWEENYKLASEKLGVDLIADPDKALELEIAAEVLVTGMLEGWFTGKKLKDYITSAPTKTQYTNARKIVNGTDQADLIAGYAVVFEEALRRGEWL
jgi:putative chitinase